jgi:bifunctional non-homologous end joining protein LigD
MKMPNISPMLATLIVTPFDDPDWLFEIKHDGFRILAYVENGTVKLRTRNNKDYTSKYPAVVEALKKWKVDAVIDGEVVVLNEKGISDFNALQNWRNDASGELVYYAFDLLFFNGKDLTKHPLQKRKAILKDILPASHVVRYCSDIEAHGVAAFKMAKKEGLEGIIAKKIDSTYTPGIRSKHWLKIKTYKENDFAIVGYTRQEAPGLISSLLLGEYEGGSLRYAGDVGTGFNGREVKEILANIKLVKKCPLVKEPVFGPGRWGRKAPTQVIWCKPDLLCKVKYLERTAAGELRHASFIKLQA